MDDAWEREIRSGLASGRHKPTGTPVRVEATENGRWRASTPTKVSVVGDVNVAFDKIDEELMKLHIGKFPRPSHIEMNRLKRGGR